jgi:KDO2-lipid IV(A) lauroyltransferase
MRHVLGPDADPAQVRATARQVCMNIARAHYDLFRVARLTTEEIRTLIEVKGLENLEEALAQGRGVVVTSAHFGNVELTMQTAVALGFPASAAAYHTQPERLFQFTLKLRRSHGLRLIPSDQPMIGLFRALKRGEIVVLPSDRDLTDHSRSVKFFGTPTKLPDGPVRVALRTGAPLLTAFALRKSPNSFLVTIGAPLDLPRTGDHEANVAAGMALVVAELEKHIGQCPEQWLVGAPIWPQNQRSPAA